MAQRSKHLLVRPASRRALAALGVATALVGALFAAPAPRAVAKDLDALRAEAQQVADEVSSLERRYDDLEARSAELGAEIEALTQELGKHELMAERAEAALATATDLYVQRAVAAYKSGGPSQRIALLLSAETMADLEAVAQLSEHAAGLDADDIVKLKEAEDAARSALAATDSQKQDLMAAERRAERLKTEIDSTLSERRAVLSDLTDQVEKLERQARRAAEQLSASSGISVGQALLDILKPSGPSRGIPDGFAGTGVTFEGVASWYGPGFEGNLTASGDVFDSSLYTVASKELPLGTWLYVEHEGKGVVVLVNDRGPYVGDRILDLSKAAAYAIGITGLGWVKAEIIVKV